MIPRVLDDWKGTWKSYFNFLLKNYGVAFLLSCNYNVNDLSLNLTGFYAELLPCWADFRRSFFDMSHVENIIWNNREIRINNMPVFMQITSVWILFVYAICYLNMMTSPLTSTLNTKVAYELSDLDCLADLCSKILEG